MKYRELEERLREVGIEEYRSEARIIFSSVGGFSSAELYLPDREIEDELLYPIIERRRMREPLAYILGKAYFYNECYKVTPEVLIPRQDTEILVDCAVKRIPERKRIIDLCTGSGCVGISTVKNTVGTTATLVDISLGALDIARQNAELNGVSSRISTERIDLLSDFPSGKYFAVLSNPPYVTDSEYAELADELYYEPKNAFLGGGDGLVFYRAIISRLGEILEEDGFAAFEIGASQAEAVVKIAEEYGFSAEILKDFSGHDRVAALRFAAGDARHS